MSEQVLNFNLSIPLPTTLRYTFFLPYMGPPSFCKLLFLAYASFSGKTALTKNYPCNTTCQINSLSDSLLKH